MPNTPISDSGATPGATVTTVPVLPRRAMPSRNGVGAASSGVRLSSSGMGSSARPSMQTYSSWRIGGIVAWKPVLPGGGGGCHGGPGPTAPGTRAGDAVRQLRLRTALLRGPPTAPAAPPASVPAAGERRDELYVGRHRSTASGG